MHTSFSISSHMFTYIIDMYVWFSVYWFSVYITSILVAAEIAKENHILKVTFWVYCTRLAPFCRTFIIEKHQRRLMHVSYCISSHIFAYINHINTLRFRMVIPSLAAAEIETAKNLLKVTSWTNYKRFAHFFFFAILVLHNCSYLVVFVFRARRPHIEGHMEPRTWRTPDSSRKYAIKISKFHVFRCDHVPSSKATRASYTGYVHNKSIGIATSQTSPR